MPRKKPFRWSALGAAAVTLFGVLAHPEILALLPEPAALVVTAVGAVVQAVTKPVRRSPEER